MGRGPDEDDGEPQQGMGERAVLGPDHLALTESSGVYSPDLQSPKLTPRPRVPP